MKTLSLKDPLNLSLDETPYPVLQGANDVLVKVHKVGICGTDLHAFKGLQNFFTYPRILGHELAVEVLEVGKNVEHLNAGDVAAVNPYLADGICQACQRGKTNCCENMQVLGVHVDGGMREAFVLPAINLLKANLNLNQLAQVEMLAIGAHAVRRAKLEAEDTVLVIGAGPIGLGTAAFAKLKTEHIIMYDLSSDRLEFVNKLGLAQTLQASENIIEQLQGRLNGNLPTTVFDATGNASSMQHAPGYAAHGGQVIFVGHTKDHLAIHNPTIHSRELSIHCSRNATDEDFKTVIEALESSQVDVEAWITHRASPDVLVEQFESWTKPETGVIKGLLEFV